MSKITKDQKKQLMKYVELLYGGAISDHGFCTYVGKKIGISPRTLYPHKQKMLRLIERHKLSEKKEDEVAIYNTLVIPKSRLPAYIKIIEDLGLDN